MSKRNTKAVSGVVQGDPAEVAFNINAEYARLFPSATPLLPGEMTLTEFAKKYRRGNDKMLKELEAQVEAGTMASRTVWKRGKEQVTYYLVQRNDNNAKAIIKKGRK